MPTKKYKVDGKRVPGVTTVISKSLGWGKEGLLYWAWTQGQDGKDFRQERDHAAEAGTIAHAMAEADVKGLPIPTPPSEFKLTGAERAAWEKARSAFEAYQSWKTMSKVALVASEISYVSRQFMYGGTIDALGKFEGRNELIDFKTSNNTYPEHIIQLAAYVNLVQSGVPFDMEGMEGRELNFPIEGIHLLRFSKEGGDFHHSYWKPARMQRPFHAFCLLRELYNLEKDIKGMV